jgi:hypothetical protein
LEKIRIRTPCLDRFLAASKFQTITQSNDRMIYINGFLETYLSSCLRKNLTKKVSHKQDPKNMVALRPLGKKGTCLSKHATYEQDNLKKTTICGTTSNIPIL